MPMAFIEAETYENKASEKRLKKLTLFSLQDSNETHDNTEIRERQAGELALKTEGGPTLKEEQRFRELAMI
ncbi:hypothetical protein TURU_081104 [Turdus rufiventris]|nr:hypothetical protein TURU_081104 [Turdus rufiventris]